MGRLGGEEPGGGGPATELAPGCVGTDLELTGSLTMPSTDAANPSIRIKGATPTTGFGGTASDTLNLSRAGVSRLLVNSSGLVMSSGTVTLTALASSGPLRLDAETVKTANYEATNTDVIVVMNVVAGGTLTLPATPVTDQFLWVKNLSANALTVARNGNTIDGAASNLSLAAGESALLYFEPSGWIRLGS